MFGNQMFIILTWAARVPHALHNELKTPIEPRKLYGAISAKYEGIIVNENPEMRKQVLSDESLNQY